MKCTCGRYISWYRFERPLWAFAALIIAKNKAVNQNNDRSFFILPITG